MGTPMTKDKMIKLKKLRRIGRNVAVHFMGHAESVPAKVDTGADSSSVWATNIRVNDDGVLEFMLFGEGSPYYTGELIKRETYGVAVVRSASGHVQIRYRATFRLRVGRKTIHASLNLSDRSQNKFPVLIGRRTLKNKFVVDVTRADYTDEGQSTGEKTKVLALEMAKDRVKFYKKYFGKDLDIEL